jgi:hypothetical protein
MLTLASCQHMLTSALACSQPVSTCKPALWVGANNEAVFEQTFSFVPIPLQFCLTSAPNGNKYVYVDGTSLRLNWDQSAGHARLLNCSAIASDEWFIAAPLGDSGPIRSVYNEADCPQVTAVNADATIAECTGTADQTFTLDPL